MHTAYYEERGREEESRAALHALRAHWRLGAYEYDRVDQSETDGIGHDELVWMLTRIRVYCI